MKTLTIALILLLTTLHSSLSFAKDLTWKLNYTVPVDELWVIKWKNPYGKYETRPSYDIRISEDKYEILNPNYGHVDTSTEGISNIIATDRLNELEITAYFGAEFSVANDVLQFSVEKKKFKPASYPETPEAKTQLLKSF